MPHICESSADIPVRAVKYHAFQHLNVMRHHSKKVTRGPRFQQPRGGVGAAREGKARGDPTHASSRLRQDAVTGT